MEMYVHGFYWQDKDEHLVILDLKTIRIIKSRRIVLFPITPSGLNKPCGWIAASKILRYFQPKSQKRQKNFSVKSVPIFSITRWIKDNYGKEGDRAEWDSHLYKCLVMGE